jgi:predicted Ser/Thr protein kinase
MLERTIGGKYRVARLLGEGGMGTVYEAIHNVTGRRVALKVITGEQSQRSPEVIGRFVREAKAAGAIDTQHIVQVLDFGVDTELGVPFLVMEFLGGEDLDQLVERVGPLAPELALRIVAQACIGLQKAHDAGVVHRDIKPANLYLARRDAGEVLVKILDFGIAKIKLDQLGSSENQALTRTGSVLGSPLYMSPEQAKGLRSIDHRTDLWSLGAVLYQSLTGRTPHHDLETLGQLIIAICSEPPRSVQDFAPWVSRELSAVVERALSIDVHSRFASADEMLGAVKQLLPQGWALHDSMFVPISAQTRALVAPRLERAAGSVDTAKAASGASATALTVNLAGTQQSLASTTRGARPARASWLVGAVLLVGGALGAWKLSERRGPSEQVASSNPTSATSLQSAAARAVAPAVGRASTTSSAGGEGTKLVVLAVSPAGVGVEVDGRDAHVERGVVEVEGALGSVHRVRLALSGREQVADVAITPTGAIPAKLELPSLPAAVAAPVGRGRPRGVPAKPATATSPSVSPAAKPNNAALDRKFE